MIRRPYYPILKRLPLDMDFILRYKGRLPGKINGTVDDKQHVRMKFDPQLKALCEREEFFHEATIPDLLTGRVVNKDLQFNHDAANPRNEMQFCRVPIKGFEFVPLVHRQHHLHCHLDIIWLRNERAGDIVQGGDIDNRLKVLFDALRMPHEEKEVGRAPPSVENQRVYTLLDDDSLITKLSITTHQLLEPLGSEDKDNDVDLLIHVQVKKSRGTWGNLSMPS